MIERVAKLVHKSKKWQERKKAEKYGESEAENRVTTCLYANTNNRKRNIMSIGDT